MLTRVVLVSLAFTLTACTSTEVQEYADNRPELVLETFFDGHLSAHGVLKNRSGKVTRYFTATIESTWERGVGTLVERFEFNDGEIQYRTWVLSPEGEGLYRATAEDVIGSGRAAVSGNALNLEYTLEIDYRDRKLQLNVDDWMWLVDQNTIINQSILRKWGFRVGSIQLTIIKHPQHTDND